MPDEKRADEKDRDENPMLEFHITPPFTRPSGPVQWRLANSQPRTAVMPMTVKVIANAKTNGWSSLSSDMTPPFQVADS
jgi:hypothetical protein